MKVVEKDDSKEKLREKSDAYKAAIEQEVKELGDRTARALVNVAVVAGAVSVAYLVYDGLTSSPKTKLKPRKSRSKELVAGEDNGHNVQEGTRLISKAG